MTVSAWRTSSSLPPSMLPLAAAAMLAAAPVSGAPVVPGVLAPLGRYGDVVTEPPTRGFPAGEVLVVGKPAGCAQGQAVWLSRAVAGTVRAAEQLLQWLETYPAEAEGTFGPGPRALDVLRQAVDRGNSAVASAVAHCGAVKGPWRLPVNGGRSARCELPLSLERSGQWDFTSGPGKHPAARVRYAPGDAGHPCQPRLSVALFDSAGKVRVLVHADYAGAALEITLFGKRPQPWRLDGAQQFFVPLKK